MNLSCLHSGMLQQQRAHVNCSVDAFLIQEKVFLRFFQKRNSAS